MVYLAYTWIQKIF